MKRAYGKAVVVGIVILAGLVLGGCSQDDPSDLQAFVARLQARRAPPVTAMPEITGYAPFTYEAGDRRSPFAPPEPERRAATNGLRPDTDRPLDPLEQFPLDALTLVGTLTANGTAYALIRAPDGVVHRAAVGSHLGRNYGRISRVSAHAVALVEIVPDGNGGYVERDAELTSPTDRTP